MLELLPPELLPRGFTYPREFLRIVEQGIVDLSPWHLLGGDRARIRREGLQQRYPDKNLVPFARRQDNDDVACWEGQNTQQIVIIHDYASPGWENARKFPSFWDWFRVAVEDMIAFEP